MEDTFHQKRKKVKKMKTWDSKNKEYTKKDEGNSQDDVEGMS